MPPKCTLSTRKFNRTAEAEVSIHDKTSALRSIGRRGNIESVNNCRAAMLATSDNDIAPPPPPPGGKGYVQSWKPCSSKCMKELSLYKRFGYFGHVSCMPVVCVKHYKTLREASGVARI